MPTLLEIGVNTPTEKVKMTPPDADSKNSPPRTIAFKKNAAPSPAVSELGIALPKSKAKNKSDDSSGYFGDSEKKSSRKRASKQRQSSIFESIGMEAPASLSASQKTPPTNNNTTPKSNSKKRKTTSAPVPKLNAKPICIHLAVEGKEPKKIKIDCHAMKKEFDDILDAPIVLKDTIEKRALPKDPLSRFLRGFGRYIS
jgi:hypothetical protein